MVRLLLLVLSTTPTRAILSRVRRAAGPSYRGLHASCPQRCIVTGPDPTHWPLYRGTDELQTCPQTMFLDFSLHDSVDDTSGNHRVHACSLYGSDWHVVESRFPLPTKTHAIWAQPVNAVYDIGWDWDPNIDNYGLSLVDAKILVGHIRSFLSNNHAPSTEPVHLFVQAGPTTLGMYLGAAVQNNSTALEALAAFEDTLGALMRQTTGASRGSMALQLCDSAANHDNNYVLGVVVSSHGRFTAVQEALLSLTNGTCLPFLANRRSSIAGSAVYADPSHMKAGLLRRQRTVAPDQSSNGSCATYTIQTGDSCATIAAAHSLASMQIEVFNNETWAWNGCANLWVGTVICVSSGTPPMPAPVANAVCGPQKPGTPPPIPGTALAGLNPCPLSACCDSWGQCGTTPDICAVPKHHTHRMGVGGCISNCQHTFMPSLQAPPRFRTVGYFEGDNLERRCHHKDARQINTTAYTHVHFAYAALTPRFSIHWNSDMAAYLFESFKALQGPLRILSIGGKAFSTSPQTYYIFRNGVKANKRRTLAAAIARFVQEHGLDGVDIAWEYPGATDIPLIPAGSADEGANYLAFLQVLREMMPFKSISVEAPATYWYLQGFPVANISDVVDYIVYQTTDLHGQSDAKNRWAQPGCPTGSCLRSAVNMTETMNALGMITRAGVPSDKVVVGLASYGHSFRMADTSCWSENCEFTGSAGRSEATPGICTAIAGFLSNAEIKEIQASPERVQHNAYDPSSGSNILIYDKNQWVSWMDANTRHARAQLYKTLNLGGTALWAINLEDVYDPPAEAGVESWSEFRLLVSTGQDPWMAPVQRQRNVSWRSTIAKEESPAVQRTGNWTQITCSDPVVDNISKLTAQERWKELDGSHAWADICNVWTKADNVTGNMDSFLSSLAHTIHGPRTSGCNDSTFSGCQDTTNCEGVFIQKGSSGAVSYEIWNSVVQLHRMFASLYDSLLDAKADFATEARDFENKLGPVKPPPNVNWVQSMLASIEWSFVMVLNPFFANFIKPLSFFSSDERYLAVRRFCRSNIVYLLPLTRLIAAEDHREWTSTSQAEFSTFMSEVTDIWSEAVTRALSQLWGSSVDSLATISSLISHGELISGFVEKNKTVESTPDGGFSSTITLARKSVYAYAAPALWTMSKKTFFILDSGLPCSNLQNIGLIKYVSWKDQGKTYYCKSDENRAYYLVQSGNVGKTCDDELPTYDPMKQSEIKCSTARFGALPGIESLDGLAFGGLTMRDIIQGAITTYQANANQNDISNTTDDDLTIVENALTYGITSPGFIQIPVCSSDMADRALAALDGDKEAGFPCVVVKVDDKCDTTTFEDETSDASPLVSDCLHIVENIKGTRGTYKHGKQHGILHYGTCEFGIQNNHGTSAVTVGNQDVIDIITDAVQQYGGSGKIGASGVMPCGGKMVKWGIYHA